MIRHLLVGLLACVSASLPAQEGPPQLIYGAAVRPDVAPGYHLSIEVVNPVSDALVFVAPYFAPGAYRQITVEPRSGPPAWTRLEDFAAVDETGASRAVTPDGDRRWKVDASGARRITLRYRNGSPSRRANNRSFLGKTSGILDGPTNWLYVEGQKDLPAHVHFELPAEWRVATGLDPTFDPMVFTAKDYDRLADCPTMVGLFHDWSFRVRGVPHRVVVDTGNRPVRFDADEFVGMVQRIVTVYVDLFDDVPYEHYTFIYAPGGGGGLEHLSSTTIGPGPQSAAGGGSWLKDVTAHEFFHAWNVKRLRPRALGPFDYTGPARVKDLWICEGLTSYYTNIGLWRSELITDAVFLENYRGSLQSFEGRGDRAQHVISPEEASWTVWDGNGRISYYLQGEVLGLALDLLIRQQSGNAKSLDDGMRRLYREHGGYYRHHPAKPGYLSEDVPRLIGEETGVDVSAFFQRHVQDAFPVDWARYLGYAGWEVEIERKPSSRLASEVRIANEADPADPRAWVQISGRTAILHVPKDSAAARAGFEEGDVLVSLGGRRCSSRRNVRRALQGVPAGTPFPAEVTRGGKPLSFTGTSETANEAGALWLEERDEAVVVTGVPRDSGPWRGGLRRGDRLLSVAGRPVAGSLGAAWAALQGVPIDGEVVVGVRRGDAERTLTLVLGAGSGTSVRALRSVAEPTPLQLEVRQGLKSGATTTHPKRRLR